MLVAGSGGLVVAVGGCCLVICLTVSLCSAFDIESSSHLLLGFDFVREPDKDFLWLSAGSGLLCTGSTVTKQENRFVDHSCVDLGSNTHLAEHRD